MHKKTLNLNNKIGFIFVFITYVLTVLLGDKYLLISFYYSPHFRGLLLLMFCFWEVAMDMFSPYTTSLANFQGMFFNSLILIIKGICKR